MPKPIIVIDDDLLLVQELRHALLIEFPQPLLVGPPELVLDIQGIRDNLPGSSAVVLDLNIGGSDSGGRTILRKLRRQLLKESIPVIIWSKYLSCTTVFEPNGIFEVEFPDGTELKFVSKINEEGMDWERIRSLRGIYPGTRAFVSKRADSPAEALIKILRHLETLPRDLAPPE